MMLASKAGKGELFERLNTQDSPFNIYFPFFALSRMAPKPEEELCKEFICLMQEYFSIIESVNYAASNNGQPEKKMIPLVYN